MSGIKTTTITTSHKMRCCPHSDSGLEQLFHATRHAESRKIAVVSGASIAGYASALVLAKNNFTVVVAGDRPNYTRENVISLKDDAIRSLDLLSGGTLISSMKAKKLISPHETEIVKNGHDTIGKKHTLHSATAPSGFLEQKTFASKIANFSNETAAYAQIADLEKGLNEFCVNQDHIHVINRSVAIKKKDDQNYAVEFRHVSDNGMPVIDPAGIPIKDGPFDVDLICIAEGSNSRSGKILAMDAGKQYAVVDPQEKWTQRNYVDHFTPETESSHALGFQCVAIDQDRKEISVTQHIKRDHEYLANIAVLIGKDSTPNIIDAKFRTTSDVLDFGGSSVKAEESFRTAFERDFLINLKRSPSLVSGNVVVVGDAAASGSPVGGYGASLALSAYPEALRQFVQGMKSNSTSRERLAKEYSQNLATIADCRFGRSSEIMARYGFYSSETIEEMAKKNLIFDETMQRIEKIRQEAKACNTATP